MNPEHMLKEAGYMAIAAGQGVWYHDVPGHRIPAVVIKVHNQTLVDVLIDEDGAVSSRTSVPVTSGTIAGSFVRPASSNDQPDVDMIRADASYKLPGQQGGPDMGGPSTDPDA